MTIEEEALATATADALRRAGWSVSENGWWSHPDRPTVVFSMEQARVAQEHAEVMQRAVDCDQSERRPAARRGRPRVGDDPLAAQWEAARSGHVREPNLADVLASHQPAAAVRGLVKCTCGEVVRPVPPAVAVSHVQFATHQATEVARVGFDCGRLGA